MKKNILTYNGSSTDNLFVLALKNDREVKLKVKDIDCHGSIIAEGLAIADSVFNTSLELYEAFERGELADGTVYIINENGEKKEYFYFNKKLSLLGQDTTTADSLRTLSVGKSYLSIDELKADKENLTDSMIYTVIDKGSFEQYILEDNELRQIGGFLNDTMTGNIEDEDEKSATPEDHDGIIDYNLPEVECGDFRYKNHDSLRTVICDMPSLTSGIQMFYGCPLTYFAGNLGSLENAVGMFAKDCRLNYESVINIVDGIRDVSALPDAPRRIDIGYSPESINDEKLEELTAEFASKGWRVEWWKNGAKQY